MMFMPFMITFIDAVRAGGPGDLLAREQPVDIGQQYFTNYLIGPPKVHNVRPADESKVAKAPKVTKDTTGREGTKDAKDPGDPKENKK